MQDTFYGVVSATTCGQTKRLTSQKADLHRRGMLQIYQAVSPPSTLVDSISTETTEVTVKPCPAFMAPSTVPSTAPLTYRSRNGADHGVQDWKFTFTPPPQGRHSLVLENLL